MDRAAAGKVLAVAPDQRRLARANRAFAIRAVRVLADAGIRQFIDLGTGFPTSPSVHEAARQADPSARVVYVDHDPVVHVHNTALLPAQAPDPAVLRRFRAGAARPDRCPGVAAGRHRSHPAEDRRGRRQETVTRARGP